MNHNKINVRFAHYSSRTPISEVQIHPEATLSELRQELEKSWCSEDYSLMRVYEGWYNVTRENCHDKLFPLTNEHMSRKLSELGLRKDSMIYLRGPLTDGIDGLGQAISVTNVKFWQLFTELSVELQSIKRNQQQTEVSKEMSRKLADLVFENEALKKRLVEAEQLIKNQEERIYQNMTSLIKQTSREAEQKFVEQEEKFSQIVNHINNAFAEKLTALENRMSSVENQAVSNVYPHHVAQSEVRQMSGVSLSTKTDYSELNSTITTLDVRTIINAQPTQAHPVTYDDVSAEGDSNFPECGAQQHLSENDTLEQSTVCIPCSPTKPLRSFWDSLHTSVGPSEPLAIARHRRCGVARKASKDDGEMTSKSGEVTLGVGATPLHLAILADRNDVVDSLLMAGADVAAVEEEYRWTPLHIAAEMGNTTALDLLMMRNAAVDAEDISGHTPLHRAVLHGHSAVVDALITTYNAKFDMIDPSMGGTTAHFAAQKGHVNVLKLLFDKGCRMQEVDFEGRTPLHLAASWGHTNAARYLLSIGAAVGTINKNGRTPLHMAAYGGHADAVRALDDHGSDSNAVTTDKLTPLHDAASKGRVTAIEALLSNGANVKAVSAHNYTPLALFERNLHTLNKLSVNDKQHIRVLLTDRPDLQRRTPMKSKLINGT